MLISGGISIISFASNVGVPAGIASANFTLVFTPFTTRIIKELLQIARNKNEKHNKIAMLPKSKLKSIETLISLALIDLAISHEKFKIIVKEKKKYEKMKEIIIMMKSSDDLGENNGIISENRRNA